VVAVEPRRIVIERSRRARGFRPACAHRLWCDGGRHRGRACSPRCRLRWNLRREKMPT